MTRPILATILAILASLACGQLVTPTPTTAPPIVAIATRSMATALPSPSVTSSPVPVAPPAPLTARVTADTVNVRSSPNGKVIAMLRQGAVVTVLECKQSWCKVNTSSIIGYVWQGCLSYNPEHKKCMEAR